MIGAYLADGCFCCCLASSLAAPSQHTSRCYTLLCTTWTHQFAPLSVCQTPSFDTLTHSTDYLGKPPTPLQGLADWSIDELVSRRRQIGASASPLLVQSPKNCTFLESFTSSKVDSESAESLLTNEWNQLFNCPTKSSVCLKCTQEFQECWGSFVRFLSPSLNFNETMQSICWPATSFWLSGLSICDSF